jgi:hypothetical protein
MVERIMGMTTPDIAGLCERLDILHEWQDSPRDRETITLSKDALERQAAEIERLRSPLPDLLQEHVFSLRVEAMAMGEAGAHYALIADLIEARAALTGEDTATLGFSGKTQTDARTRGDA